MEFPSLVPWQSHRVRAVAASALLAAAACAPATSSGGSDGAWVGALTTEGNVTVVVNESGSVWGGTARLLEEASIGVAEGADEYMLGLVAGVWAAAGRIYVVDSQVPTVRVYDWEGRYLLDIGRQGEGPGEFATEPTAVATTPDGDVVVSEAGARLHRFAPDGTPKQTRSLGTNWILWAPNTLVMSEQGVAYKATFDTSDPFATGSMRLGRQAFESDGSPGAPIFPPELGFEPWCLKYLDPRSGELSTDCAIPFAPVELSVLTPDLTWVVGINDSYRFEMHRADGGVIRVERRLAPVPLSPDEVDYNRRQTQARIRRRQPDWVWDGPEIPDHKPAYRFIVADRSGRIWLSREGPSRRVAGDCTDDFSAGAASGGSFEPCWVADRTFDVFDAEGRYLGDMAVPRIATYAQEAFIQDDVFVAPVMDERGVVTVKRYRIVLPGSAES